MATYKERLDANNAKIEAIQSALQNKVVGKGQLDIRDNGVHEVVGYEKANVQVPIPDLSATTATESDVVSGKKFYNASGELVTGEFVNPLQLKCDTFKKLDREFEITSIDMANSIKQKDVIAIVNSVDTKNVESMQYTFYTQYGYIATYTDLSEMVLDMSNCSNISYILKSNEGLTKIPIFFFWTSRPTIWT